MVGLNGSLENKKLIHMRASPNILSNCEHTKMKSNCKIFQMCVYLLEEKHKDQK